MKSKAIKMIVVANLLCSLALAQDVYFKSYTSATGLSQNSGYSITQDKQGYIWMGTQDGLNRFNGKKIVTYYKETITRGTLGSNFIKQLFYDSVQNQVWIGTVKGLTLYDVAADSFYNASHFFPAADTLNGLMIRSINRLNGDEIAVVTFSEGLFICNTKTKQVRQYFQQQATKNETMAALYWNKNIVAICNGGVFIIKDTPVQVIKNASLGDVRKALIWQNELWIASSNKGLFQIKTLEQSSIKNFDCGSNRIGALVADKNNNLWIGTRDKGLIILEPQNLQQLLSYEKAGNQDEWPKPFTLSLFTDKQGLTWTGSSGGGFTAAGLNAKQFGLIRKKEVLAGKPSHNMIYCMEPIGNNLLYLGTQLEGLRIFDLITKETTSYNPDKNNLSSNAIYGIAHSSASDVWLATEAGMYHFNAATKKFTHYTDTSYKASLGGQSVFKLQSSDSLLYSSTSGIVLFDLKKKKFAPIDYKREKDAPVNCVSYKTIETKKGVLWMGTMGDGLVKYTVQNASLKTIAAVAKFSAEVYGIYNDNGNLWLGTANGLLIYNIAKDKITKAVTVADGLPGNVVYSVEKDNKGFFWCSTNRGLVKINPAGYRFVHIPATVGLQAGEFNKACSFTGKDGTVFFGGINGISFFNPENFAVSDYSPDPVIESVKIYNQEIQLPQNITCTREIKLAHNQNFISIEFGVNNFINNDECTFRYKLTGADEEWVNAGNRNYVSYASLKPGTYVFKLQSANSGGKWSKNGTDIKIIITPALWQTWWMQLLLLLLIITLIVFLLTRRISAIRKSTQIKQQITETEMAALKAQMNPHFMFNCINSIDAFIHSNDKYNATLYLNKFAKLLRNILDSSKQNTVSFSKDIETLKLYVELEELRHENKFKTSISIDDDLLNNDYKVPPLIIQPFVENAILHGLKNREDNNGVLQIEIRKKEDKIVYTITDNGIGRSAASRIMQNKESHYGMQMSYERIKLFNKEQSPSVEVTDLYKDEKATGTTIKVQLKTT